MNRRRPDHPPAGAGAGLLLDAIGESRFAESRFAGRAGGEWIDLGAPGADGQTKGVFMPTGESAHAQRMTILRAPAPAPSPANRAGLRPLNLPGSRSGVLLFHGLSSTPKELKYLARGLNRAGHTVRVAVIEGYSHGLPAHRQSGHQDWARAALAEFDRMRPTCDTLAVGGLCIGSLLALHVSAERAQEVSHLLALSTALRYDGWAAPWTRKLLPLARIVRPMGRLEVKEREPFGLKDERLRAWIAAQMKESGGSDAGAAVLRVRDLLEAQDLMDVARHGLGRITAPALLIHAREDDAASVKSTYEVARRVRSSRVQQIVLDDSYHMISIDQEKARVLAEMVAFLQNTADAPVSKSGLSAQARSLALSARSSDHVRV